MAKVVKLVPATPEKFGPQPVRRKKKPSDDKARHGQLNLFTAAGGKVVSLHQQTPFEEALMLDEQGHKADARTAYLKAIADEDSVADAYCNLGILESQEGNFPQAIDCFSQCLKHDPRHHEAHYNLANLYAEAGNFPLAKLHYETAIAVEPLFTNSYFNLALTLAMTKAFAEAVEVLHTYRTLTPPDEHQAADDLIVKLRTLLG